MLTAEALVSHVSQGRDIEVRRTETYRIVLIKSHYQKEPLQSHKGIWRGDELLNGELFYNLKEARIIIESWRRNYNGIRPHTLLGYEAPAPKVLVQASPRGRLRPMARLRRPR